MKIDISLTEEETREAMLHYISKKVNETISNGNGNGNGSGYGD